MLRRRIVRNPKKELALFVVVLLLVIAAFFAVLNYLVALRYPPVATAELTAGFLRYTLQMPKTHYNEGVPIPLHLSVTNISDQQVALKFEQDLEFDFIIQKELNLVFATVPLNIWKYSASHPHGPSAHERVLQPGQTLHYRASWPQINSRGEAVGPGRYIIMGVVNQGERHMVKIRGRTQ